MDENTFPLAVWDQLPCIFSHNSISRDQSFERAGDQIEVFLALGQANNIIFGSRTTDSIPLDLLSDPAIKISFQILRLVPSNLDDDEEDHYDWKRTLLPLLINNPYISAHLRYTK
ncbi:hypothetical protein B0H14DRAFT_3441554 [Mycena olivaceomarginata]|nr:hypothetical protein B0H14DRAFT_3441554 [Mycena olivaceomarginata]